VIDVPGGHLVARGLSMPHSPRVHEGRLWVLDSGSGRIFTIDPQSGKPDVVSDVPGFPRGLAFAGRYAFVGLSKIRETTTFGGLPSADRRHVLKCGVWVFDAQTGQTLEWLEFDKGVEEIFDVQVLPAVCFPAVVGFQKDTIHGIFVVPAGSVIPPSPGS
jgi:uncharacterized protein (TIGR03032 family)